MKVLDNINIDEFFKKIQHGSLLILDYDGTLAPFAIERLKAYPYQGVKERLTALMDLNKTRIVIVSGRSLSDLEKLLDIGLGLELWGSHGLERKLPTGEIITAKMDGTLREGLDRAIKICEERVDPKQFEIKPYSVAIHWRGMDPVKKLKMISAIPDLWKKICSNYDLEIHPFDEGLELRPKGHNKGDVIRTLLSEMPTGTPIAYLGDDMTDEDAFAALGDKGLKVLVRKQFRPTLADIYLTPPDELLTFLDYYGAKHAHLS